MAEFRRTKKPGVFKRHQLKCNRADLPEVEVVDGELRVFRSNVRCNCDPTYRGKRRHPLSGASEWQKPAVKSIAEVQTWLSAAPKGRRRSPSTTRKGPRSTS